MGKKLDFKEIKLSSKIRDIHKIEKKSISIRVFGYENKEKHQIYKPKICCKETHVDLLLLGKEGKRQIIFKNNLPICDFLVTLIYAEIIFYQYIQLTSFGFHGKAKKK